MKILIAEDDLVSRKYMMKILENYGKCDYAVNGIETIDAFLQAAEENRPYDLICLDIMMPKADGIKSLKTIRKAEKESGIPDKERVKIIITTALNDTETINNSYSMGCDAFISKPIEIINLIETIKKLGLL